MCVHTRSSPCICVDVSSTAVNTMAFAGLHYCSNLLLLLAVRSYIFLLLFPTCVCWPCVPSSHTHRRHNTRKLAILKVFIDTRFLQIKNSGVNTFQQIHPLGGAQGSAFSGEGWVGKAMRRKTYMPNQICGLEKIRYLLWLTGAAKRRRRRIPIS